MFKVLVSDPISDMGIQQLMDADDIAVEKKTGLSEDELVQIIAEYDGLLVRSQTKVTEKIMAAASRLKVIGRAGVGVDNIDLEAATKRGIIVINAPDGNTITTCEHAFAMMMALARHIPQAYAKTISGQWDRKFLGVELRNKTLGVLGMGRIGSEVAKRAKAFGMEILGYDPFLTEDRAEKLGVKLATVDDIVRNADFITVHTPLTPETKHMIARPQFEVMKKACGSSTAPAAASSTSKRWLKRSIKGSWPAPPLTSSKKNHRKRIILSCTIRKLSSRLILALPRWRLKKTLRSTCRSRCCIFCAASRLKTPSTCRLSHLAL